MLRRGEHHLRIVHFDQLAEMKVSGAMRDPGRLLQRVRDDGDGVIFRQLRDQLFDPRGGDGIQRGTGFVHQDHLRIDGDRAGNAQPLLLTAGQAGAGLDETILYLFPQARLAQAGLDDFIELDATAGEPVQFWAIGDVIVDTFRKGIGLLKHHAHPCPQRHRIHFRRIDVLVIEQKLPGDATTDHRVVHAVQGTQKGGLAAARGTDHGDDLIAADIQPDVEDCLFLPVVDIHVAGPHLGRVDKRRAHGALCQQLGQFGDTARRVGHHGSRNWIKHCGRHLATSFTSAVRGACAILQPGHSSA